MRTPQGAQSDDAQAALAQPESATALLRRIRERIHEGTNRIGEVPLYREIAQGELDKLEDR